jgi:hypothetical protein
VMSHRVRDPYEVVPSALVDSNAPPTSEMLTNSRTCVHGISVDDAC